jgi:hypothetical protein
MSSSHDDDLPFRHYISALLDLREVIARTKGQTHQLAQLHEDVPFFLTDAKLCFTGRSSFNSVPLNQCRSMKPI